MDRKLFFKLAAIALMSLLLLIPLSLIEDQVRQRGGRQADVQTSIANSAAGPQTLVGPVLAIKYRERLEPDEQRDPDTGRFAATPRYRDGLIYLPPETLQVDGEARVETRARGIYQARLFHLNLDAAGRFVIPPHLGLDARRNIVSVDVSLVLGISDPRGVGNDPEVVVAGRSYRFAAPKGAPAEGDNLLGPRLTVALDGVDLASATTLDFRFPLKLTGTERLAIAPTGEANRIAIKSDWRHPSFGGRFLPREREVTDGGFSARWEVSHLARNFADTLAAANAAHTANAEVIGVSFMDPVNIYLQSERAVKYGILFIVLTFAGFFLTEIQRRSPLHPMQYLLVGLALALFFLLLIALSEHIPFAAAYGIAAAASIALNGVYLAGALGGARPGLAFAAALTGLYGVLYGVLLSEDNSLLMGSLLLFLALGAIMLATRRVDWYRLDPLVAASKAE